MLHARTAPTFLRVACTLLMLGGLLTAAPTAAHHGPPYHSQYPTCSNDPNTPDPDFFCDCQMDPNLIGAKGEVLPRTLTGGTRSTCDPCMSKAWFTEECPICPDLQDPNADPNGPAADLECAWEQFCGTVQETTEGMTNHGVVLEAPYVGQLYFVRRPPDVVSPHAADTVWDCSNPFERVGLPGSFCGEVRVRLQDFAPPETDDQPLDIHGPIDTVSQTGSSYHLNAIMDDFVVGPTPYTSIGSSLMTILCTGCGEVNDKFTIEPDYKDLIGNISGEVILSLAIPGIGGTEEPEGESQDVRLDVTQLGGACNNILPATSSWGLVGLVGLLVVSAVFFGAPHAKES